MSKFIIILFVIVLAFSVIGCSDVDKTGVQQDISHTAIGDNASFSLYNWFFNDVVCSDPGNTMPQCENK